MIVEEFIEIIVNNSLVKHYKEKGYIFSHNPVRFSNVTFPAGYRHFPELGGGHLKIKQIFYNGISGTKKTK